MNLNRRLAAEDNAFDGKGIILFFCVFVIFPLDIHARLRYTIFRSERAISSVGRAPDS